MCVINGDENIFAGELLGQGLQGGRTAAQHLTKAVAEYLANEDVHIFGRLSFWIVIFYNRLELTDLLTSNNVCTMGQFDAFLSVCTNDVGFLTTSTSPCQGFSQSSARFLTVDVGHNKEATDSKIKGTLDDVFEKFYSVLTLTVRISANIHASPTDFKVLSCR
jgi:hypothetical protein